MTVAFQVFGIPAPQGSKQPMRSPSGKLYVREQLSESVDLWRSAVAAAAAKTGYRFASGPLTAVAEFRFPMPKSRPVGVRRAGRAWKTTAPDLDKIIRATGDALKASGMIQDDALIVHWSARKLEVWDDWTGAAIMLYTPRPASDVG